MYNEDSAFAQFLSELGVQVSMVARYGGVLIIYPTDTDVKILYIRDEKDLNKAVSKIKAEVVWLDEDKLRREMLNAKDFEGDI